jgi:hypothetical protein
MTADAAFEEVQWRHPSSQQQAASSKQQAAIVVPGAAMVPFSGVVQPNPV